METDDDYELEFDSDNEKEEHKKQDGNKSEEEGGPKDGGEAEEANNSDTEESENKTNGNLKESNDAGGNTNKKSVSKASLKKMYASALAASKSTKPKKMVPKVAERRVGGAKTAPVGVRQEHDLLVMKEKEIAALKQEVKTLQSLHRRQTKALQDMDTAQEKLPQTISSLQDEIRGLREQTRVLVGRLAAEEKNSKVVHEQLQKYKSRSADLLELIRVKGLEESGEDSEELEKAQKKVSDLEHQVQVLMKIREQDEKKMRAKLKEAQQEITALKQQVDEHGKKPTHNNESVKTKTISSPTLNGKVARSPSPAKHASSPVLSKATSNLNKPKAPHKTTTSKQPTKKSDSEEDEYDELFDDTDDEKDAKPKIASNVASSTSYAHTTPPIQPITVIPTTPATSVPVDPAPAASGTLPSSPIAIREHNAAHNTSPPHSVRTSTSSNTTNTALAENESSTPSWLRDTPSAGKGAGDPSANISRTNSAQVNRTASTTNSAVSTPTIFKPNMGGGRAKNDWKSKLAEGNVNAPLFGTDTEVAQ